MVSNECIRRSAGIALAVLAALWSHCPSASAAIEGRHLVVGLQLPPDANGDKKLAAAEAQMVKAAACSADGVAIHVRDAGETTTALVRAASDLASKHRLRLWLLTDLPNPAVAEIAHAIASLSVEGLALSFAPPNGDPADPADRNSLLAIKRQGDKLGEEIRNLKMHLGPHKRLALCAALPQITPDTARGHYVPVADLVRDGTAELVALSDADRNNFHRLRLLRDTPLVAGSLLDGRTIDDKRRAGMLSRAVLEAVQNDTSELLWLTGFPVEMLAQVVPTTVEGLKRSQRQRAALEAALAKGQLLVDQEVAETNAKDQATLHGVAQSFTPSRDGSCPLVQVYLAIRGSTGPLPPPLHLEIRDDAGGKPGKTVLAKTEIPAADFGLEPAYRWGSAQLEPPVALKKGQTCWIYLTNARHPDGNYVWRIASGAAGPRGHAWSSHYDYTKNSWVFRVFLSKEPSR